MRAVEKKVRDAGDSGWSDPQAQARAEQFQARAEQYEQQAQKAAAAGRTKEADEAKANAEQWRQWAQAAVEALTRKPCGGSDPFGGAGVVAGLRAAGAAGCPDRPAG